MSPQESSQKGQLLRVGLFAFRSASEEMARFCDRADTGLRHIGLLVPEPSGAELASSNPRLAAPVWGGLMSRSRVAVGRIAGAGCFLPASFVESATPPDFVLRAPARGCPRGVVLGAWLKMNHFGMKFYPERAHDFQYGVEARSAIT